MTRASYTSPPSPRAFASAGGNSYSGDSDAYAHQQVSYNHAYGHGREATASPQRQRHFDANAHGRQVSSSSSEFRPFGGATIGPDGRPAAQMGAEGPAGAAEAYAHDMATAAARRARDTARRVQEAACPPAMAQREAFLAVCAREAGANTTMGRGAQLNATNSSSLNARDDSVPCSLPTRGKPEPPARTGATYGVPQHGAPREGLNETNANASGQSSISHVYRYHPTAAGAPRLASATTHWSQLPHSIIPPPSPFVSVTAATTVAGPVAKGAPAVSAAVYGAPMLVDTARTPMEAATNFYRPPHVGGSSSSSAAEKLAPPPVPPRRHGVPASVRSLSPGSAAQNGRPVPPSRVPTTRVSVSGRSRTNSAAPSVDPSAQPLGTAMPARNDPMTEGQHGASTTSAPEVVGSERATLEGDLPLDTGAAASRTASGMMFAWQPAPVILGRPSGHSQPVAESPFPTMFSSADAMPMSTATLSTDEGGALQQTASLLASQPFTGVAGAVAPWDAATASAMARRNGGGGSARAAEIASAMRFNARLMAFGASGQRAGYR